MDFFQDYLKKDLQWIVNQNSDRQLKQRVKEVLGGTRGEDTNKSISEHLEALRGIYILRYYPMFFANTGTRGISDTRYLEALEFLDQYGPFEIDEFDSLLNEYCDLPPNSQRKTFGNLQSEIVYGATRFMVLSNIDEKGYLMLNSRCEEIQNVNVANQ